MTRALRDVGLVARFEVGEAFRSRLLVVMVVLFVGAGALGAWGFGRVVEAVEQGAARATGAPTTRRPGGLVRRLRASRSYRDVLRAFTRSDQKADYYAQVPPMVVFFAWASFAFTPWLVLFCCADTIAQEVSTRSIRFSALRIGRLAYALGKALGQLGVVIGVTTLQALAFFAVAWATLDGVEPGATALGLAVYLPRVLVYLLPFLAWALMASMVTRGPILARVVACAGGGALSILASFAANPRFREGPAAEAIWDLVRLLTPFGHAEGLFYPPGGALASDVAVCLALAVLYFGIGFAVLRRRDL